MRLVTLITYISIKSLLNTNIKELEIICYQNSPLFNTGRDISSNQPFPLRLSKKKKGILSFCGTERHDIMNNYEEGDYKSFI